VNEIITTIRITERFKKMLVIGHRGCGKSTILNKVAEDLKDKYHIVSFSVAYTINMVDVETVDILLAIYLQVLESVKEENIFKALLNKFDEFAKIFKQEIKVEETGVSLLGIISFKFRVEPESRAAVRQGLFYQIRELQKNISEACGQISKEKKKDMLIIIDDLDKLDTKWAEHIFFENSLILTVPEAKIIYAFPLDTYYHPDYRKISNQYESQLIPVVTLYDNEGNYLESSRQSFTELILKRIVKQELIKEDAMKYVIDMSGGLLRDLVKFMQDACKTALMEKVSVIDKGIAEDAVNEQINDYYRVFDESKYAEKVRLIAQNKKKVDNETLVYLLRYLFVLEYQYKKKLWYDVHPCLKKAL